MRKLQLKYLCLIIIFAFFFFSCKKEEKISIVAKREAHIQKKREKIDSTKFKEMKISSLPAGSEEVIKYFHKITYDQDISYISEAENQKVYDIETNLDEYLNSSSVKMNIFKYPQKNNYDFGSRFRYELDSISTSKDYYVFTNRLPDIGNNKIYLTRSNEPEENFIDFIRNIDLVILDQQNNIINSLNLNYFSINSEIFCDEDIPAKHFYIDKDYIIHVKYFLYWGEGSITTLAYIKYKIQQNGNIVRYFDQKEGAYKSFIEKGIVKNHTKEGKWKEYLGGQKNMYSIINYKNGVVDGLIKIYGYYDSPISIRDTTIFPRYSLKLIDNKYYEKE